MDIYQQQHSRNTVKVHNQRMVNRGGSLVYTYEEEKHFDGASPCDSGNVILISHEDDLMDDDDGLDIDQL